MPISEKIHSEIKNLYIDEKMKELMNEILDYEDDGAKHYKKQYMKYVDSFLGEECDGEDNE